LGLGESGKRLELTVSPSRVTLRCRSLAGPRIFPPPKPTTPTNAANRYRRRYGHGPYDRSRTARDIHSVLVKVREGVAVVIEQDHRPIAVIKPPKPVGRSISEVLADLKARSSTMVMDDDFARDIE
jgi:antitoxin (DNA-binding transcriptional repressor) of toxin-antitoxin stability system